jgi:acyl dehydratase
MMVNYGMDKMKFGQAVVTGSSVRLVTTLQSIANLRGTCKAEIKFVIEIKDSKKPAIEGVATFLYFFEN